MRRQITKWGNSLAVRIPRAFAAQIGVEEGSSVEVTATGDRLVVRRAGTTLAELVGGITPENRHGATDFGPRRGREVW